MKFSKMVEYKRAICKKGHVTTNFTELINVRVLGNPKNTPKEKHKLNHIPQSGSRNNVKWDRKKAFMRTAANGQWQRGKGAEGQQVDSEDGQNTWEGGWGRSLISLDGLWHRECQRRHNGNTRSKLLIRRARNAVLCVPEDRCVCYW